MEIGAFELNEPLPSLKDPHLLAILKPWVDVGSVGTLVASFLEEHGESHDLGQLKQPSNFYDLTRYRPMLYRRGDWEREVVLPNTHLRSVQLPSGPNLIFAHTLEPHTHAEEFVQSIADVMEHLGVKRFCLVGAMYAPMPHTRPLKTSGVASDPDLQAELDRLGVRPSTYEGPTSALALIMEEAHKRGISSFTTLVQLPSYAQLEEDYTGQYTLMKVLDGLYDLYLDLEPTRLQGERQYKQLDQLVQGDPRMKGVLERLEEAYDSSTPIIFPYDDEPQLSSEVEQFLRDVEGGEEEEH